MIFAATLLAVIALLLIISLAFLVGKPKDVEGRHESVKMSFLLFFIACVASLVLYDVASSVEKARDKVRSEAIEHGFAHYETNANKETTFVWNERK